MKFHKDRTTNRRDLEGQDAYIRAAAEGKLQIFPIRVCTSSREPHWKLGDLTIFDYFDHNAAEALEVSPVEIGQRAMVVDELTRHRFTKQFFVPVDLPLLAVVGMSMDNDPDSPDPENTFLVSLCPGNALEIGRGTWHTLPFTPVGTARCLSIMHRENLDNYHDVRDLTACGWVGIARWSDPTP